jgi:hypothetical protein
VRVTSLIYQKVYFGSRRADTAEGGVGVSSKCHEAVGFGLSKNYGIILKKYGIKI